jgi:mannose-1-phosphate guanylyltransferase / mannose-6-phosphate isomerase
MSAGDLHAVILAGGSGTRFWPLSRERLPKQLLPIVGDRSMLALTLDRALLLVPEQRVWVVTTRPQAEEIRRELTGLGRPGVRVIVEPAARNTAAAIGLAAVCVLRECAGATLAVFPADHHIARQDRFVEAIRQASKLAAAGWLVTLGIRPSRPETGYGYIRRSSPLASEERGGATAECYRVALFTEKPDPDTARTYLESGQYSWNSGIFVWRADRYLEEVRRYLPGLHPGLREIGALLGQAGMNDSRVEEVYLGLESVSVDYGILERSKQVAVVPVEMGWNDVGSWAALRDILDGDGNGNILQGDVLALSTSNCLVRSEDRLVATLGVDGLVIVDTPDALLVCREASSQDVKKIPERLRQAGREEAILPRRVLKPWGAYRVLTRGEGFQVKEIDVEPGHRLSLQSHRQRAEHWIVATGTATVTVDGRVEDLPCGGHIHIPTGSRHRVENRGTELLRLMEVQTGEYLGEDDIVRYEDDYGRMGLSS